MNVLHDIIPRKARKYVYAAVAAIALVWSLFEASNGDWKQFTGGLIGALVSIMAAGNTPAASTYSAEHGRPLDS